MLRLLKREALAYLKLGLLMPTGRLARRNVSRSAFGVVFVPGMGANESQFIALAGALSEEAEDFDAFDYSFKHPAKLADELADALNGFGERCDRYLVIGHSLGGLLARMVLQRDRPPHGIAGFVSICAPLHGTWRSRLAPHPGLRALRPDSALMQEIFAGADRLDRWKGNLLAIGARHDQFIAPFDSAFLPGHPRLELDDVLHTGSLFDPRVHQAIGEVARRASIV